MSFYIRFCTASISDGCVWYLHQPVWEARARAAEDQGSKTVPSAQAGKLLASFSASSRRHCELRHQQSGKWKCDVSDGRIISLKKRCLPSLVLSQAMWSIIIDFKSTCSSGSSLQDLLLYALVVSLFHIFLVFDFKKSERTKKETRRYRY